MYNNTHYYHFKVQNYKIMITRYDIKQIGIIIYLKIKNYLYVSTVHFQDCDQQYNNMLDMNDKLVYIILYLITIYYLNDDVN